MEGARLYAQIISTLDEAEIVALISDDDFPEIAWWLAQFADDELVNMALDRLLRVAGEDTH